MDARPNLWGVALEPVSLPLLCIASLVIACLLWRRLLGRHIVERAREEERGRIARELHDTLMQSVHALLLELHFLSERLPHDSEQRATLRHAIATAESVIGEGRDRIAGLRAMSTTPRDRIGGFALAARLFPLNGGHELARAATPSLALKPAVQEAALRIAVEALRNAVRHACARTIDLHIEFGSDALRLRVRDDGVGLDAARLPSLAAGGHWGLVGMAEHADRIGGQLALGKAGDRGTEIRLAVPAEAAYLPGHLPSTAPDRHREEQPC